MRERFLYQGKQIGEILEHNGVFIAYGSQMSGKTNSFKSRDEAVSFLAFEAGMHCALHISAFDNVVKADAVKMAQAIEGIIKLSPKHLLELRIALAWIWDENAPV